MQSPRDRDEMSAEREKGAEMEDLVGKRNATSVIWKYFGYKNVKVFCRECLAFVVTTRGNTTNLFDHLSRHHKALYDECRARSDCRPKQKTILDAFASVMPYEKGSKRQKDITDAITFHLAKDMVPIDTVTKHGLANMIRSRYVMPSRTYFSQIAIPELYDKCKAQVETELLSQVKYYDEGFQLRSHCLQTAFFPDDQTGENIAMGMREALAAWSLDEKRLVTITTDNAANMVKAAALNKWTRLQCFGHRLHFAIGN